jgi:hypothetical protein
MAHSADHRVECHRLASERRAQGKPVWDRSINIREIINRDKSNTSHEHLVSVAHEIAALLRRRVPASTFDITNDDYNMELDEIVEEMESLKVGDCADDPDYTLLDHFNGLMHGIYDWADYNRVWLG